MHKSGLVGLFDLQHYENGDLSSPATQGKAAMSAVKETKFASE
jgi:hypothetical protein